MKFPSDKSLLHIQDLILKPHPSHGSLGLATLDSAPLIPLPLCLKRVEQRKRVVSNEASNCVQECAMTCGWCADPLEIRFVWHMDLIMAQASLGML